MFTRAFIHARNTWAVGTVTAALCGGLAHAPVKANVLYEFNQNGEGWTSPSVPPWTWSQTATNEGSWKSLCTGTAFVSYLYSPCLEVNDPVHPAPSSIDIDFQHRFHFQTGTTGVLWGAGQVQYMLNNSGTWQGIATWASSGTELMPLPAPPPGYTTPPLLSNGAFFAYTSPKYANTGAGGVFDKSSFQISGLTIGDEVQFRFATAMVVSDMCPSLIDPRGVNPLWDVDEFQVKGVVECVPEPGSIALAATGALFAGIELNRRRMRSRRMPCLSKC